MKILSPFQKRIITTVILISIAISGYLLSKVVEQQMRKTEFSELLLKTQMLALLISPDEINQLKANEEDLMNPIYLELKKKLIEVKNINADAKYIYLLGLNESTEQFYFVGSELDTSNAYIAPGTLNEEAVRKDIRDHLAGSVHVYGPYETSEGEWISAYAPILNDDGSVSAVVRMDVESEKVVLLITIVRRAILLITALVVALLLLMYLSDQTRKD